VQLLMNGQTVFDCQSQLFPVMGVIAPGNQTSRANSRTEMQAYVDCFYDKKE